MDNNKPSNVPEPAGVWVPQNVYSQFKDQEAADLRKSHTISIMARTFFILLAVGGLMVAVAFIGNLIAPTYTTPGRGSMCTHSTFEGIQFYLNLIGYPLLFGTGIFGVCINRVLPRTLGIILMIGSPLVGLVLFLMALGNAFCGA